MNIKELVSELNKKGVLIRLEDGDQLNFRAPPGVLTQEHKKALAEQKTELLELLKSGEFYQIVGTSQSRGVTLSCDLGLSTASLILAGVAEKTLVDPVNSRAMAPEVTVTFRPLPETGISDTVREFCEEFKSRLEKYGVKILPWEEVTEEEEFEVEMPLLKRRAKLKLRRVRGGISAVIDVMRPRGLKTSVLSGLSEMYYGMYARKKLQGDKLSVSRILESSAWADDYTVKYVSDPTNTQVVTITDLNPEFASPETHYSRKIGIGVNDLINTMSEIVIGVSPETLTSINMNLSDFTFPRDELDYFILFSVVPKIFAPLKAPPLSRFKIGEYDPGSSPGAKKLVDLGLKLRETGLFPSGSRLNKLIKRKSHQDIISLVVEGRTGVSYGFVAFAEPPVYQGPEELPPERWDALSPVEGMNPEEIRADENDRWYMNVTFKGQTVVKQIPDITLVSTRSGSDKTAPDLKNDIVRLGVIKGKTFLDVPRGADLNIKDIRPSFDTYVMLGITLSAALFTPDLIKNGMPIVHFHGYPAPTWFQEGEYFSGPQNPAMPCGTVESALLNFMGVHLIAEKFSKSPRALALIEPDHGTNLVGSDIDYLLERIRVGIEEGTLELGGRHYGDLKKAMREKAEAAPASV